MLNYEPYASNLAALEREERMLPATLHMSFAQYSAVFPLFSQLLAPLTEAEASRPFAPDDQKMYGAPEDLQVKWLPAILEAKHASAKWKSERAAMRAVSISVDTEKLPRYQGALDNEWYKTMWAFREARQHRLHTLDSV
jgi:hypothetical protein